MPITPQVLALNPLKDMTQVDEIDYTAEFFNTGKIFYSMLK